MPSRPCSVWQAARGGASCARRTPAGRTMIAVPPDTTATTTKLLLTTLVPDERTAWSKARADVSAILQRDGYATVQLPQLSSPRMTAQFWSRLKKELAG